MEVTTIEKYLLAIQENANAALGYLLAEKQLKEVRKKNFILIDFTKKTNEKALILNYNQEDLKKMPQLKDGRPRLRKNGSTEIRYRKNGYDKSFCAPTLAQAKELFKNWCSEINGQEKIIPKSDSLTFKSWSEVYLNDIKKPAILDNSFKNYMKIFEGRIYPVFATKKLKSISPLELQRFFNKILEEKKGKTAEDCKHLLNGVFKSAVANRKLKYNPMDAIIVPKHYRKNGSRLTPSEEIQFLKDISGNYYEFAFKFILFSGVRLYEYTKIKIDNIDISAGFIVCLNAKVRKNAPEENKLRRFPISPKLMLLLQQTNLEPKLFKVSPSHVREKFKEVCPWTSQKALRHTFISRARDCGIEQELVALWTGHTFKNKNTTSIVYTHFSEEQQLAEISKLNY